MRTSRPGKAIFLGVLGGMLLVAVFVTVVLLSVPLDYVGLEFERLWYWVLALSAGFGVQVGLYAYIRQRIKEKTAEATAGVAASGTISTGAMVACCSHALVNVLPLLGLSAAAVFLARYQTPLILLGVFSSLTGITIMLGIIQNHDLAGNSRILNFLGRFDMKKIRYIVIALGVLVVAASILAASASASSASDGTITGLASQSDRQGGVTVEVEPGDIGPGGNVRFMVTLSTHTVELGQDLAKTSLLETGDGSTAAPLAWEGDPPGGHHRKGTLVFGPLPQGATSMKLILKDIAVPERTFEWRLD